MTTQTNTHPPSNDRKKRRADDSLIVSDDDSNNSYPTFIVVEPEESHSITLSIFAIQKLLKCAVGDVKNAKKLRNGSVLIEVASKAQAENALKMHTWISTPVKVSAHRSLNSCKGIIRCRDLRDCSDDEVREALSAEGVTHVKHLFTKRNESSVPTNTFIITFNKPTLPKSVRAAYLNIPVEPFVPGPLRCYKCQKFGHGQNSCSHQPVCARCGIEGHKDTNCPEQEPKCANCSGDHPAYSRQCPEWIKQQAIVKIKTERNISFNEAKQLYSQQPANANSSTSIGQQGVTYASVCKSVKSISTQTDITWPNGDTARNIVETSSCVANKHASIETQTSTENDNHLGDVDGSTSGNPAKTSPHITSTPNRKANSAPKVKISLPSVKPGPASSKPSLGNKHVKGSDDPIKLFNKYGSLDSMDLEVYHSPTKGPGSRKKS